MRLLYPCGALWAVLAPPLAAQTLTPPALERCLEIGAPADRLACYDKAMGRAPAPAAPPAYAENPAGGAPASSSLLAPKDDAVAVAREPEPARSLMSRYWELEPEDKRGIFNFVGYRANYVLPLHVTSRINRAPQSPNQPIVELPNYRREEAKFQLSLRTKLAQDVLLPGADLWAGFTQQAMWQIWNGKDSKPFRNSDYEPELIYVVPTPERWRRLPFDWQWRYAQFSLTHQSNGQSDPLSRSWNRVSVAAGFERGDWSVVTRFLHRLREGADTDNNPDLVGYRGRGEFQLNWVHQKHTAQLLYRTTLKDAKYGAAVRVDVPGVQRSAERAALVRSGVPWLWRNLDGLQLPPDQCGRGVQLPAVLSTGLTRGGGAAVASAASRQGTATA